MRGLFRRHRQARTAARHALQLETIQLRPDADFLSDETRYEMWRRPFLIGFLCTIALCAALPASAFERPFPAQTKRGQMTPALHPAIIIDGKPRQLSPGARIWNENNLIEMPASLRGSGLAVNYTENDQGDINRVWILTPEEASQPVAKQINPLQQ
jgi:hypothetical protein